MGVERKKGATVCVCFGVDTKNIRPLGYGQCFYLEHTYKLVAPLASSIALWRVHSANTHALVF